MLHTQINADWQKFLQPEFSKPYMNRLQEFLRAEQEKGQIVYPAGPDIFNALNTTPFDDVNVVILGQDPYHGEGQAHGLSFSVRKGVKLPPSLRNIYKEIEMEFGTSMPKDGDLSGWRGKAFFC